ncbi:YaaA family protein [Arcanobacterium ihumii]|uniref:YaaA family protein n=1 Tax=Arcanobacterium ihumii TaxID=2138162 RepID=UPI000F52BFFC|nr:peroxide stress protein YaaA [Arcanobacterium ihumii]
MLILLPPSESKTTPASGSPLNFDSLSSPNLNATRQDIAKNLIETAGRDDALTILKVGPKLHDVVAKQTHLLSLPCAPAREIYTGVLFSAMELQSACSTELSFADEHILIFSALFGVLRPSDMIPPYRLSMGVTLPGFGNTKKVWKKELASFSPDNSDVVIDCRSGNYRVWNPPVNSQHISINAVREHNGERKVISHNAKHFRGLLAKNLVKAQVDIQHPEELLDFAVELIGSGHIDNAELISSGKNQWQLVLVQHED